MSEKEFGENFQNNIKNLYNTKINVTNEDIKFWIDWYEGKMNNFSVFCPNDCGSFGGYLSPDEPLDFNCPICESPMSGYRIIKKEGVKND